MDFKAYLKRATTPVIILMLIWIGSTLATIAKPQVDIFTYLEKMETPIIVVILVWLVNFFLKNFNTAIKSLESNLSTMIGQMSKNSEEHKNHEINSAKTIENAIVPLRESMDKTNILLERSLDMNSELQQEILASNKSLFTNLLVTQQNTNNVLSQIENFLSKE